MSETEPPRRCQSRAGGQWANTIPQCQLEAGHDGQHWNGRGAGAGYFWHDDGTMGEDKHAECKAELARLKGEVERQKGLLEDGSKGMAILIGEVESQRQENRELQHRAERAETENWKMAMSIGEIETARLDAEAKLAEAHVASVQAIEGLHEDIVDKDGEIARLRAEVKRQRVAEGEAMLVVESAEYKTRQALARAERAEALLAECRGELAAAVTAYDELDEAYDAEIGHCNERTAERDKARTLLAEAEKALEEMLAHSWDATTLERKARAALQRIREGK